jgi:hypothetical protein
MKIRISLSLFFGSTGALGDVSGELDLIAVPSVGSSISLLFPTNQQTLPINMEDFPGVLKVVNVLFNPSGIGAPVTVTLEDVVLKSESDARIVMKYLEQGFGLFGDEYEHKDA